MDNLKLKILHTESSDGWGGQEIRILLEAQELIKRGHNVTIVCPPHSGLVQRASKADIPTILINFHRMFDVFALWKIMRLIKKKGIHIVHTHSSIDSWVASIGSKMAGVPILVRTRHLSVPIATHIFNFVYKMPDAIITTGESIRRRMIEINKLDGHRVLSIPTGVQLDRFNPRVTASCLREELHIGSDTPVITMVAVLRSWKRHEVFLEAAKWVLYKFPQAKFLIVGDGPGWERIHGKIVEFNLGENVIMTGHREDIPEILSVTDVAVLTSERYEGVPQAVLQYLAMERPVVATSSGSTDEAIRDGETGILVPPNNARNVAEGILRLLNDKELGQRLGKNGRKLVEERFSSQAMMDVTLNLYYDLYKRKVFQKL